MLEMRFSVLTSALVLSVLSVLTSGCATTAGSASGQDRVVVAVDPQTHTSSDVEITEVLPLTPPEAVPARRRLSQTVTLGQGTVEPVYAPAPVQQSQGGGNSQTVTVNNNIVVQPAPVYYGGYGSYGNGSYGNGRSSFGESRGGSTRGGSQAWAPNGWEGAGRTAAPGRTPGVGGNFAPAPSFGPRSMR